MKNVFILLLPFVAISSYSQTENQKNKSLYLWKYTTTAHKLLFMEQEASLLSEIEKASFFGEKYKSIDNLIDSVGERINSLLKPGIPTALVTAEQILKTIDSCLIEQNYIVCITTEKLSDALTPRELSSFTCQQFLTKYAKEHVRQFPLTKYFGIDCDLGAILYLSLGEVYHLPLKIVEVLNHNFIRWRFNTSDYFNWDNNSARIFTDDDYRNGLTPTSASSFTKTEEINNHFLEDMTDHHFTGYYTGLIAEYLNSQKRYTLAISYFNKSIAFRSYDAISLNNLSWMYLTVPELESLSNYKTAFTSSNIVDSLLPRDKNYKDTYSCACAGIGNFTKAIDIEKQAFNKPEKIKGFLQKKTCLKIGVK